MKANEEEKLNPKPRACRQGTIKVSCGFLFLCYNGRVE